MAVLADVALGSSIRAELASSCANPAGTSGAGNDVLSKRSASSVRCPLIAIVIASGGVIGRGVELIGCSVELLPEVVGGSAGSAGVVVLVETSQTVLVAEVADIGQPAVWWASCSEGVRGIGCFGSGQPEVKIGWTVPNTLVIGLAIGDITAVRESARAKGVILDQGSIDHANRATESSH